MNITSIFTPELIIVILLVVGLIVFGFKFSSHAERNMKNDTSSSSLSFLIGVVTNFFDTLGIGSFAPTTALLKVTKSIDDRLLPGTLNVAFTIPVMLQAIIFIKAVEVDILTLVSLIGAAVVGAYFGAGIVSNLSRKKIKIIMGFALMTVAFFLLLAILGITDSLGGDATGLTGTKLIASILIFLVLGALMSAGVGLYAPAMVTVLLMGMNPLVAFPIMMGACAFLMPVGSLKFIKENAYAPKLSLFLSLGGVIGVVFATSVVTSMDLDLLKNLVVVVCVVTGYVMIREGLAIKKDQNI